MEEKAEALDPGRRKKRFYHASNLGRRLVNALFPHFCPLCHQVADDYICLDCSSTLKLIEHGCQRCSLPLTSNEKLCGECLNDPPPFKLCLCAYAYQAPLSTLISMLKDNRDYHAVRGVCGVLAATIKNHYEANELPELLFPVPIHWRKRWIRGFNQAELIALILSDKLDIPLFNGLTKSSYTPNQRSLSRKQRQRNLSGSFALKNIEIRGKRIAIVDDVVTTSSTIRSLAETCLLAGASQVDVWALARTPKSKA